MKRSLLLLLAATALVVATIAPAGAITYGEPDGNGHPYVGMMLFYDGNYPDSNFGGEPGAWFSCSGTLLSNTVFLTAGHCTYDIGTDLAPSPGHSGGTDVWVTFDNTDVLDGFPSSSDFTTKAARDAARAAWLDANWDSQGTAYPHPLYDNFVDFPATHDVGVVVLDNGQSKTTYGALPALGVLDGFETKRGQTKIMFETVGYGIQEIVPNFQSEDTRYHATSKLVNLRSHNTDGYNLHTSNNPGKANGVGGACFGDSGGPVFGEGSNLVLGVVSFGMNYNCKGADFSYRADIADTQDFLAPFLP